MPTALTPYTREVTFPHAFRLALRARPLYAMTYGAIPLVRRTGGLADTVIPYHPSRNTRKTATGLSFVAQTTQALIRCIYSAQELYRDKPLLQQVQDNAMARDYSWDQSSAAYVALYESVVNRERADG